MSKVLVVAAAAGLVLAWWATGGNPAGVRPPALPGDSWVLPSGAIAGLLKPCSRVPPRGVTGAFTPSRAELDRLEQALPRTFSALKLEDPLSSFTRQYAGLLVGTRRIVYVNFFPSSFKPRFPVWPTTPALVCDGGKSFWGIEFDLATGTFGPPQFGGEA